VKLYAGIGKGLKPEKDNAVVVIAAPTAIAVITGQVNVTIKGFAKGIFILLTLYSLCVLCVPYC
jgi:hypothetical protein